ncbi:MAG: PhnD/SsuA/transferrin family substrate-binding protein [Anaerolineales bacterium]
MKKVFVFVSLLVAAVMLLTACGPAATPTPVPPTPVPPTATPVPPPALGTADNPLVMALAPSANTTELMAGGEAIAAKLTELTGYVITTTVPTNYAALVEAMGSGNAQIGWLPTVPYIVAYEKGYATVGLVTLRSGADHYAFEFIVNQAQIDNGTFTSYYDAATSTDTADAATALAQFAGKRPCYTDPLSSSGYLVPAGFLASLNISTKAGAWVQGHPTVVKSIYLSPNGEICDFGTVYVDARTNVTNDFPDVNDKVTIVFVSDPIIPNDTVSFAANMDPAMRQNLVDALLQIASTEDGLTLLKNGGYSIGGLKAVDDSFYDQYRVYLESINFDINSYK